MKAIVKCAKCGRLRHEDRMESRTTWSAGREYRCLARSSCKTHRRNRPMSDAEFERFVESFNGDEAGDIDDVSALNGDFGWAMRGGNDARAVFDKAIAALDLDAIRRDEREKVARDIRAAWVDVTRGTRPYPQGTQFAYEDAARIAEVGS